MVNCSLAFQIRIILGRNHHTLHHATDFIFQLNLFVSLNIRGVARVRISVMLVNVPAHAST